VIVPEGVRYTGEKARGIVVINHLRQRGRRLGHDVFVSVKAHVPLDLVGTDAQSAGGIGEIGNLDLAGFSARYRFFFNPIRWTSLGLAVIEAMTIGMPIVGLATTELATVIRNGESGYIDTNVNALIGVMREMLRDSDEARRLGNGARKVALERFHIDRFVRDWNDTLRYVTS
jgi:glycosyltransferase involved in cell wall biosynthesis